MKIMLIMVNRVIFFNDICPGNGKLDKVLFANGLRGQGLKPFLLRFSSLSCEMRLNRFFLTEAVLTCIPF
jgi:hypothetical protein